MIFFGLHLILGKLDVGRHDDFFFWSSLDFGKKFSYLFFWSSPDFGREIGRLVRLRLPRSC